jgi:hypothetical protein
MTNRQIQLLQMAVHYLQANRSDAIEAFEFSETQIKVAGRILDPPTEAELADLLPAAKQLKRRYRRQRALCIDSLAALQAIQRFTGETSRETMDGCKVIATQALRKIKSPKS